MSINFRPHHFLCTLCFQGKGYSPTFIQNFTTIKEQLDATNGDMQLINITEHTDSICAPCPHRRDKQCEQQQKIEGLDQAHAQALGWQINSAITWGDAKKQIKEKLNFPTFHQICAGCNWKSLGVCEGVIKTFLKIDA